MAVSKKFLGVTHKLLLHWGFKVLLLGIRIFPRYWIIDDMFLGYWIVVDMFPGWVGSDIEKLKYLIILWYPIIGRSETEWT